MKVRLFAFLACLALVAGAASAQTTGEIYGKVTDKSGAVVPGDQLRIEVTTTKDKDQVAQVYGVGTVAGKVVCEAVLMFTLVDP